MKNHLHLIQVRKKLYQPIQRIMLLVPYYSFYAKIIFAINFFFVCVKIFWFSVIKYVKTMSNLQIYEFDGMLTFMLCIKCYGKNSLFL